MERLQKFLASCGVASRRASEKLIAGGRVTVNGDIVTELGTKVDPGRDRVCLDDRVVRPRRIVCFALHKPRGVLCTNLDEYGRRRAVDLVDTHGERAYTAGRLDKESEGLVLITNDGELTHRLTHPRYGVLKVYRVKASGDVPAATLADLRRGVHLAEGKTTPRKVTVLSASRESVELEITLGEGRYHEVRRILARMGLKVRRLKRIAIGCIQLGGLKPGAYRPLTRTEESYVAGLKTSCSAGPPETRRWRPSGPGRHHEHKNTDSERAGE
jgi:23S rRNA pseudouridine2605 synthase